jgi:hypothetical protein
MTDQTAIIISAIAIIPPIVPAVFAYLTLRSSKRNGDAIETVHIAINSRMDELLKVSKAEAKAEGVEEGRAEGPGP